MTEFTVVEAEGTRLLLAAPPDYWVVVDLVPDQPIRMTRYDDETAARAAFTTQEDTP